jgi:hypothetical protein
MMTAARFCVLLAVPLVVALGNQTPVVLTFNDLSVGATPAGFSFGSLRQKVPGRWTVQKRDPEMVLFHERDSLTGYSLAICDLRMVPDIAVTARVRFVDGARAGGLVWRYVDDNHYYSLILDMAKSQITLQKVSGGDKFELEVEDDLELDPKAWHTLKIVHVGESVRAMLGGVRVFEDSDRRNRWSGGLSRAGLIATGNSGVEFDDLTIAAHAPKVTHP